MMEHDHEPIRGLPGDLPPGEHIIWQGVPDARVFARAALATRWIAVYFAALALLAALSGSFLGAILTLAGGSAALALLHLFAWGVAKTTVYTLTNRRIVLRIGVALEKCINLPLVLVSAADLRDLPDGHGDIALMVKPGHGLGYLVLWPHARPWQIARPQPMLRAVPDAATVAALLARTCAELVPNEGKAPTAAPAAVPAPGFGRVPERLREVAA